LRNTHLAVVRQGALGALFIPFYLKAPALMTSGVRKWQYCRISCDTAGLRKHGVHFAVLTGLIGGVDFGVR